MVKSSSQKRKKGAAFKKSPEAPKRFKSSYILYFTHVHDTLKKTLPQDQATAPLISKRAAEMWKNLPVSERQYWDDKASKEKERYLKQKEVYNGPWKVPNKRAKKDRTAPKRNPSAFLLFASTRRNQLREIYSHLENTAISRILGHEWRTMSPQIKSVYVNQERAERDEYKEKMKKWKLEKELREIECEELCSPDDVKNVFQEEEDEEEECDNKHVDVLLKNLSKVKTSFSSRDLLEKGFHDDDKKKNASTSWSTEESGHNHDQLFRDMLLCPKEDLIEPASQKNTGVVALLGAPTKITPSSGMMSEDHGLFRKNLIPRKGLNFRTIDQSILTFPNNAQKSSVCEVSDSIMQSFPRSQCMEKMLFSHSPSSFSMNDECGFIRKIHIPRNDLNFRAIDAGSSPGCKTNDSVIQSCLKDPSMVKMNYHFSSQLADNVTTTETPRKSK